MRAVRCSAACLMQACYSLWLYLMQIIATSGAMVVYLPVGERSVLIWVGVRAAVRAEGRWARVGSQLQRCCSGECREAACVEAVRCGETQVVASRRDTDGVWSNAGGVQDTHAGSGGGASSHRWDSEEGRCAGSGVMQVGSGVAQEVCACSAEMSRK